MDRYLLDTCTLLWAASGNERLSARARRILTDTSVELYLSAASVWEISIKSSIGRLPLPAPPLDFIERAREELGLERLPIDDEAAVRVAHLPGLHNDPFDRIIVAQALVHQMTVITSDAAIAQYGINVLW